ncbi:helix-turn-helix transcriptional regulator [Streptomyces spectabilis]|uniref:helix-turn-helix transcriptional regulator n=1 Tax=Streptomyces spectabilis TaxID=68270 RepID=UPI0033D48C07
MTTPQWPALLLHLVDLIGLAGDKEAAELVYGQLALFQPYPGAIGTPTVYFCGNVSRELGRLALIVGRPAQAEELLREALARNRALRARPYVALTCLDLATIERDKGALASASALAQEALAIADQLDLPGSHRTAINLIEEIAAQRDRADPLTLRERQIAELVIQPCTNRQIAKDLFISERTVETHVRNILAKLGYANRNEMIARWLNR